VRDHRGGGCFPSTILRKHLDDVPLWRGDHVAVKLLVEDFARYLYLPRLAGPEVLTQAIRDGLALLTWQTDTFGYAESYDEGAARYRGLRGGQVMSLSTDSPGLLVKPDLARRQMDAETTTSTTGGPTTGPTSGGGGTTGPGTGPGTPKPPVPAPKRFHGTVTLDPTRVGRDSSRIAEEVIAHLAGLVGSDRDGDARDRSQDARGCSGQRRAHRHREQPHAEVHAAGIREGLTAQTPTNNAFA
jgi:hypothetical protein